jgi:hypothetical protein
MRNFGFSIVPACMTWLQANGVIYRTITKEAVTQLALSCK